MCLGSRTSRPPNITSVVRIHCACHVKCDATQACRCLGILAPCMEQGALPFHTSKNVKMSLCLLAKVDFMCEHVRGHLVHQPLQNQAGPNQSLCANARAPKGHGLPRQLLACKMETFQCRGRNKYDCAECFVSIDGSMDECRGRRAYLHFKGRTYIWTYIVPR